MGSRKSIFASQSYTHSFHPMVQYGHSNPSHHVTILQQKEGKEQKSWTHPWRKTSQKSLMPVLLSQIDKNLVTVIRLGLLERMEKSLARRPCWPCLLFSSVAQSCRTLCDPMDRSTPGLPVHRQLPEFAQSHAHRVDDAIQPPHPLLSLLLLPSVFPSVESRNGFH